MVVVGILCGVSFIMFARTVTTACAPAVDERICCSLFMRRFTKTLAKPSEVDVPTGPLAPGIVDQVGALAIDVFREIADGSAQSAGWRRRSAGTRPIGIEGLQPALDLHERVACPVRLAVPEPPVQAVEQTPDRRPGGRGTRAR